MEDEKKYLYCTKCDNTFMSKSKTPRCPQCKSVLITEYKNVSAKADILKLKPRVAELETDVALLREGYTSAMTCIEDNRDLIVRLVNEIKILKGD